MLPYTLAPSFTSSLHLRQIPLLFYLFALCCLFFPSLFPNSRSPWGQSIAAERGDASQLTLWHLSKLTPCNPYLLHYTDLFAVFVFFLMTLHFTYIHYINTKPNFTPTPLHDADQSKVILVEYLKTFFLIWKCLLYSHTYLLTAPITEQYLI